MAQKKRLVDEVLAKAQNQRPGYKTWAEKLPPELQVELEECRQKFDHGTHQKSAFARAIVAAVAARGYESPKLGAVVRWLSEASRKK